MRIHLQGFDSRIFFGKLGTFVLRGFGYWEVSVIEKCLLKEDSLSFTVINKIPTIEHYTYSSIRRYIIH